MKFRSELTKNFQTWCRSAALMSFLPTSTFAANASYPAKLNRGEINDLKAGCLLPIDGLDIAINPGDRILILGAGGAEDMMRFIHNGYECMGVEADRNFARKTKVLLEELGQDSSILLHSDVSQIPSDIGSFNLILFTNQYYSKIIGSRKRIDILKILHKLLEPTGKIYFEFEMRPEKNEASREFSYPVSLIRMTRFLIYRNKPVIEKGVRLDPEIPLLTHHFLRHEITRELSSANLAIDELFTTGSVGSVLCRRSCPLNREPAALDRRVLQAVS